MAVLPDAEYLVLASRLVPDRDGGFTISVLRRALDMASAGATPTLLTFDPATTAEHDADRDEWIRRSLLNDASRVRNMFDAARADSSWLLSAALTGAIPESPWPYRAITDDAGNTVMELPVISGDSTWFLSEAPVRVLSGGVVVGWLPGYASVYRAWINAVASRASKPLVVICEARQLGEALMSSVYPLLSSAVRIVHTTHACHVTAPFAWDSPMDAGWQRWFAKADQFDAVLWLTPSQQRDVERRFGGSIHSSVVPHPAPDYSALEISPAPGRIVVMNSLIPRKRVDHVLRALAELRKDVAHAHVHVYGDGALRDELALLADELGVKDAVTWRGQVADPTAAWATADVFVLASTNEGQGLVVLEALAAGVPVVSYDMPYGPRDSLASGGGVLVDDGDIGGLTEALRAILSDRAVRARRSAEGRASALQMDAAASMAALGEAVSDVLARPPRRV
ncbi:glycosyltransferase (plasmid) [Coraliomargarita sp. W4R53]